MVRTSVIRTGLTCLLFLIAGGCSSTSQQPKERTISPGERRILLSESSETSVNQSSRRLALVIGNGDYNIRPLPNPVKDSQDISQVLQKLGFQVTLLQNATWQQMGTAIREFGSRLHSEGGVGLVYFAGHGIQVSGENYLLPVDFSLNSESSMQDKAISAQWILETMATEPRSEPRILILDACRDNPFVRNTRSLKRGLAKMKGLEDMMIAYSASPGIIAYDGEKGENSPYARALLQSIEKPGVEIEAMLRKVALMVHEETRGFPSGPQTPWKEGALMRDFCFAGCTTVVTHEPQPLVSTPSMEQAALQSSSIDPSSPTTLTSESTQQKNEPKDTPMIQFPPEYQALVKQGASLDVLAPKFFAAIKGKWEGKVQIDAKCVNAPNNSDFSINCKEWADYHFLFISAAGRLIQAEVQINSGERWPDMFPEPWWKYALAYTIAPYVLPMVPFAYALDSVAKLRVSLKETQTFHYRVVFEVTGAYSLSSRSHDCLPGTTIGPSEWPQCKETLKRISLTVPWGGKSFTGGVIPSFALPAKHESDGISLMRVTEWN